MNAVPDHFGDSPEAPLSRRTHMYNPSPSTSKGGVPELHIDTVRAKVELIQV